MRTRRSPRNQDILWRALGGAPEPKPEPAPALPRCWDCRHFPKGGRARATCRLNGLKVNGVRLAPPCFEQRPG